MRKIIFLLLFLGHISIYAQHSPDTLVNVPRFEDEVNWIQKQIRSIIPKRPRILFTGSSSIKFWTTLKEDMRPLSAVNHGFGGSTLKEVHYYADRIIIPVKPDAIVLYAGENDLNNPDFSANQTLEDFKELYFYVNEKLPEIKWYFIAIKLSPSRQHRWETMEEANRLIEKFANSQQNLHFIDVVTPMRDENGKVREDLFLEDRLHLNEAGYKIWTDNIKPVVLQDFDLN
ncbi:MAG: hypothetical protein JJU28_10755 [Cyclobacteriaceae bacterium]|nr:hypothetical protein [Cyclobacteriaceae bacterium]